MNQTLVARLSEYIRATNTHQFDEVAPLIDEEAVFWFTSGSYRGLVAIRAAFERAWAMIQDEVYALEEVEWLAADDSSATCIYTYRWRGRIDGVEREGSGRGTTVWRRQGQQWRVVHEHLSAWP